MSLNQIVNPSGSGLNLQCHQIKDMGFLPRVSTNPCIITEDDLVSQRLLLIDGSSANINYIFPSSTILNRILPQSGDFFELTVKYKTTGTVVINQGDATPFILGGNNYPLESSNGTAYKTQKIGVARTTVGGDFRMY